MKIQKKVVGSLEKCYSLSLLEYRGSRHFLVAAEKVNQCRMYDLQGSLEEVVWEQPGGTMSLVPVPGADGQFLATQRFYSPNDSKEASIVSVTPEGDGKWRVRTLAELPFVHRFDILKCGGRNYLIACTLKSGHSCKDDWTEPGKVYAAELPNDLTQFDEERPLQLQVMKEQMLRNHGYFKWVKDGCEQAVIACEQGIFRFAPPLGARKGWEIEQLLDTPASDMALMDLDGCGVEEMLVFSPFHGDRAVIYKKMDKSYRKVYEYPQRLEFLHAVCCGYLCGRPAFFLGYRKGQRELLALMSDGDSGFVCQVIDSGCGPANVLYYSGEEEEFLLAANRETDEIAMYTFSQ